MVAMLLVLAIEVEVSNLIIRRESIDHKGPISKIRLNHVIRDDDLQNQSTDFPKLSDLNIIHVA